MRRSTEKHDWHKKNFESIFLVNLDNWHVTENSKIQLAVVYLGWSINLQRKWGKFIDFPTSKIVFRMIESFSPIKATLFSTYFLFKLEITWETVSVCANKSMILLLLYFWENEILILTRSRQGTIEICSVISG